MGNEDVHWEEVSRAMEENEATYLGDSDGISIGREAGFF
jgi:hypothetical protein